MFLYYINIEVKKMEEEKIIKILKGWAAVLCKKDEKISREEFLKKCQLPPEEKNIINELIDRGLHLFLAVPQAAKNYKL